MISTRWRFALAICSLSAAAGCGSDPVGMVALDDAGGDVGGRTDQGFVDVGTPTDRGTDAGKSSDAGFPDVVAPDDVPAPMDVVAPDDVPAPMDAADDVPAVDVVTVDTPAVDVPADGGPVCPAPRETITLPSMTAVSLTGSTASAGTSVIPSSRCQGTATGAEAIYTLVVTSRLGVILSTDNAGTAFDTVLSIRRSCLDTTSEISCDDDSGSGTGRLNSSVLRAVLDPGTYTVVVDGFSGASGAYTLTASTFTPADNATCSTARALTVGTALTGQTFANAGNSGLCSPGLSPGGQVFYAVTLPANTVGTAQVSRASGDWGYALRVYADCDATTCLQFASSTASPLTQVFANATASPRTYVVSVAQTDSTSTTTPFDIVVNTAALTPGQVCESPVPLVAGTPLAAQSNMGAPFASALCRTSDTGGQRFYTVTIPAGQRARVTATPTGATPRQPVLRLLDDCAATACADSAIGGTSTVPAAAFLDAPNTGTAPRTVVVALASTTPANAGSWDLTAATAAIVPGQFCAAPVTATPGMTLNAQDAREGLRPTTACVTTANGGQLFYRVSVPTGNRVQVRAVPAGAMMAWTPTLRALSTCASTSCVDSSTAAAAGSAATLSIVNAGAMAQDYLFSVAGSTTASGTFNLEVGAASPLPGYTVSTITAACDDVTGGTAVVPASSATWSDDSASAITALPFTASFFGDEVTRWALTSNGLLQLFAATGGSTSTTFTNSSLPSTSAPNGFVAAFWDDLLTLDTGSTTIATARTVTLGTAPARRFVTQWTDFTATGNTLRLTFQAKLFEGSNNIEIHYCSVTADNPRASGNSATIGAESLTGAFATQVSFDTAGAAVTGRAYRLAPR